MEKRSMKFLVIQTAFPGDVILTLPLIQETKKLFPHCSINVVVIPACANILENHPDVSEIISYDKKKNDSGIFGFVRMLSSLRKKNFDVALIPHRSLRSALLAYFSFIPKRIGFDTSVGKSLFTNIIRYDKNIHEVERNLCLLSPFGFQAKEKIFPSLFPSDNDKQVVENIIAQNKTSSTEKIISVAPGSVWNTKRWLKENFISLSKKIIKEHYSVFIVGGKNDEQLCEEIKTKTNSEKIVNSAGKLSLLQSAEIIRRSSVLICNDSAPMHLAVAMKTPVVSIWGATIPEFGFAPFGENDSVFEMKNLSCRPCGIHGGNVCPIETFDCMKMITPEIVFDKVKQTINRISS